jgi:hypothetical protein
MSHRRLQLFVVGCLGATAATATAESLEAYMRVVPAAHGAPTIEATIVGGPMLPLSKYRLRGPDGASVVATRQVAFRDGTEPIAIALVVSGQEIFVGNDQYETDEAARYGGALDAIETGIDRADLADLGPPGSRALIATYGVGAALRVPPGPLADLRGAALGREHDYRGQIGDDLVAGVTLAVAELSKIPTERKVLIVIGDGNDTNPETARPMLAELKRRAAAAGIETFAIVYKTAVSAETTVITAMIPRTITVNSRDGLSAELAAIGARIADRYTLTFPGEDLAWDGRDHELTVQLGDHDLEPIDLVLPARVRPVLWAGWRWLTELGFGALLVAAIAIGARHRFAIARP